MFFKDFFLKINSINNQTGTDVEGSTLELHKISRLDMGVYMCIASNGVPPTVSKRIFVSVDCESTRLFAYSHSFGDARGV